METVTSAGQATAPAPAAPAEPRKPSGPSTTNATKNAPIVNEVKPTSIPVEAVAAMAAE